MYTVQNMFKTLEKSNKFLCMITSSLSWGFGHILYDTYQSNFMDDRHKNATTLTQIT